MKGEGGGWWWRGRGAGTGGGGGGGHFKAVFLHGYDHITSVENLLEAWKEFLRGKRGKLDVLQFQRNLMSEILRLHGELRNKTYRHGGYRHFRISDPKPRDIHKAGVRDRLVHHAIHRWLYPYFEPKFTHDSYSCRAGKGTHRAMNRFHDFAYKVSLNHTRTCWILKCDIRKFFASVDHAILKTLLREHIEDSDILWLLGEVIDSFPSRNNIPTFSRMLECPKGLPLGNLTSQLLVNVYMNEFDQFVKHKLKVKYYIRYADDFVLLSRDRQVLEEELSCIKAFLRERLKLELHPNKVSIETIASGIDFLGWVHFVDHRVLRTTTKRRMLKRLTRETSTAVRSSYGGLLTHGNTQKLRRLLRREL